MNERPSGFEKWAMGSPASQDALDLKEIDLAAANALASLPAGFQTDHVRHHLP
jgi:hypothetical protein